MSASTTHHPRIRECSRLSRLGGHSVGVETRMRCLWKLASKMGSITSLHACGTTRSRTVGIPNGRCSPSGLWSVHAQHRLRVISPRPQVLSDLLPDMALLRGVPPPRWSRHHPRPLRRSRAPPARPATGYRAGRCGHTAHGTVDSGSSWPLSRVCAGALVSCLWVWLALAWACPITYLLARPG